MTCQQHKTKFDSNSLLIYVSFKSCKPETVLPVLQIKVKKQFHVCDLYKSICGLDWTVSHSFSCDYIHWEMSLYKFSTTVRHFCSAAELPNWWSTKYLDLKLEKTHTVCFHSLLIFILAYVFFLSFIQNLESANYICIFNRYRIISIKIIFLFEIGNLNGFITWHASIGVLLLPFQPMVELRPNPVSN